MFFFMWRYSHVRKWATIIFNAPTMQFIFMTLFFSNAIFSWEKKEHPFEISICIVILTMKAFPWQHTRECGTELQRPRAEYVRVWQQPREARKDRGITEASYPPVSRRAPCPPDLPWKLATMHPCHVSQHFIFAWSNLHGSGKDWAWGRQICRSDSWALALANLFSLALLCPHWTPVKFRECHNVIQQLLWWHLLSSCLPEPRYLFKH